MEYSGTEWSERPDGPKPTEFSWPTLRPNDRCDGENPMTGRVCINGRHKGYHSDASGAEWLDD
ncbi:hypothetical protein GCM10009745_41650 [Kribbella yunnanensis]|uniref:Uncharacterized protein n=2 Tax=Kribbella yunnanensis TaxID=190194 RepID=A0ABP4TQ60_9ACTN